MVCIECVISCVSSVRTFSRLGKTDLFQKCSFPRSSHSKQGQEQSSPTVSAESQVTITPELIEQKHVELMTRLTALKGGKIVDQIDLIEELKDKWNSDLLLAVFLKYQTDEAAASVPGGVCHKDSQVLIVFIVTVENISISESCVNFVHFVTVAPRILAKHECSRFPRFICRHVGQVLSRAFFAFTFDKAVFIADEQWNS
jgi:hypothetical protein